MCVCTHTLLFKLTTSHTHVNPECTPMLTSGGTTFNTLICTKYKMHTTYTHRHLSIQTYVTICGTVYRHCCTYKQIHFYRFLFFTFLNHPSLWLYFNIYAFAISLNGYLLQNHTRICLTCLEGLQLIICVLVFPEFR